jgi:hypothetical protein
VSLRQLTIRFLRAAAFIILALFLVDGWLRYQRHAHEPARCDLHIVVTEHPGATYDYCFQRTDGHSHPAEFSDADKELLRDNLPCPPLEGWRKQMQDRVGVCRRNYSAFRHTERFGLVIEVKKPIVFWFEQFEARSSEPPKEASQVIAFLYARVSRLIVPEATKAPRTEAYVSHCVPDIFMSQIGLNQTKIRATLAQVIAARMPESVGMNIQGSESSTLCNAIQHQLHGSGSQRPTALGNEHEIARLFTFAAQTPQGSDFTTAQIMVARYAALGSLNVKDGLIEVKLGPLRAQSLLDAQPMGEQKHNQRRVPVSVTILTRRQDEFFNLAFQQMFAVACTSMRHCSPYGDWNHVSHAQNPQCFHRVASGDCS